MLAKIGNNLVARYQKRIFDHLMRLGVGFFNDTRSGQLAARINENVNGIRDLLGMTLSLSRGDAVSPDRARRGHDHAGSAAVGQCAC